MSSKSRKHRPTPLVPCKPPPLCPLPTVPNSQILVETASSSENDSDSPPVPFSPPPQSISPITQLHIGRQTVDCSSVHRRLPLREREREGHYVQTIPTGVGKEWTLRLGVPSSPSPSPCSEQQPPSARVPTVRVTLSDTDADKDDTTRERRRRVKSLPTRYRHQPVLSQFQTKSQGNLRRAEEEEEGEKDWTLSLPLSISLTRTLSFSHGAGREQEKEQKGEQQLGRGRVASTRSRVTSLHPQATSNTRGRVASLLAPQQHPRSRKASPSPVPTHSDKHLGAPSRTPSRSVSPSRWSASSPSAGYVSKDDPSPSPRASAGASPLIIPPSALAARAKQGKGLGSLPPSSFSVHRGRVVGSQTSLVSASSSSSSCDALASSRASLGSSRVSLRSSCVYPTSSSRVSSIYHPPSTASSSTSTSSVGSATSTSSTMSVGSTASKMSVMSATSTTSTSSSDTIIPARASITITRAGENLEFPMPPMYAGGVGATASPRNSLSSSHDPYSLTPPPPSLDRNINGRLTPPPVCGTGALTVLPPPSSGSARRPRPSPSPSDSMWTDDDDTETETETETIYEDAVSMLSGVYYSARSSFDF